MTSLQPYTKLTIAGLILFIPSVKLSCSSETLNPKWGIADLRPGCVGSGGPLLYANLEVHAESRVVTAIELLVSTHRLRSSSILGLPYRILNINHKEELLRGPGIYLVYP